MLSWHLNNGKTVYRNYRTINVTELREQLDSIYENQSYKLGMYPVLSLQADDIAGVNYKEEEDCSHVKLLDEQTKAALLAAYQKELMARRRICAGRRCRSRRFSLRQMRCRR